MNKEQMKEKLLTQIEWIQQRRADLESQIIALNELEMDCESALKDVEELNEVYT